MFKRTLTTGRDVHSYETRGRENYRTRRHRTRRGENRGKRKLKTLKEVLGDESMHFMREQLNLTIITRGAKPAAPHRENQNQVGQEIRGGEITGLATAIKRASLVDGFNFNISRKFGFERMESGLTLFSALKGRRTKYDAVADDSWNLLSCSSEEIETKSVTKKLKTNFLHRFDIREAAQRVW
ncbi:hypothetical protein J6590_060101 [Homalodisca vitripennis]|nr:hypothetical protein J6590_060101 [Homalodisca vitripennis]